MKIEVDCVNCFVKAAIKTHQMINPDDWKKVTPKILSLLSKIIEEDKAVIPGLASSPVLKMVNQERPGFDPYKDIKRESNILAKDLLADLRKDRKNNFSLEELCLYAAASNIIDYAIISSLDDCHRLIHGIAEKGFAIFHFDRLTQNLRQQKTLLYFTDNSGEVIFDRLLLQYIRDHFDLNIKVCINKGYILNDATKDEIIELGFMEIIDEIVEIEPEYLGVDLEGDHAYLKKHFTKDAFIIAKGMANYECFSEYDLNIPIFSIFLAKCRPIAALLGVEINDAVLKEL